MQSSNGLPIVNINRPSSDGVSRNEYDKFNVDKQGALLNNSSDIVLTQQAGYIDGNSALAGQSAHIILNEVVSSNPSHLRGYTEVAGAAAEVVIANPNGIICNGCGFINSPRGVLTTGRAQFNTQGNLTGYRVEDGQVTIEGDGLNASNLDQLDILARAVRVNSELWANKLNLVTGKNKIDHKTLKATPLPSSDTSGVALDVAAIGGMYANRISLVGTEKGFGVNSQGQITASQDFQLTSEGKVQLGGITRSQADLNIATTDTLENSGILTAKNIQTTARSLHNNSEEAVIHADENLQLTVTEDLHNQGRIQAETLVTQSQLLENRGTVSGQDVQINSLEVQNQNKDSALHGSDTLDLQSDTLNNEGSIQGQELNLNVAASLDNQGKVIGNEVHVTSSQLHNQVTGSIHSQQGSVELQTSELNNEGVVVAQQLDVTTDQLNNSGGMQGLNTLTLNLQALNNLGQLLGSLLNLNATQVTNQGTVSGGETQITAQQVHNQGKDSVLHGSDTLDLQSHTLNNEGLIQGQELNLNVAASLDNQGKVIGNEVHVTSSQLNNQVTGSIHSQQGSVELQTSELNNEGIVVAQQLDVTTDQLNNSGGMQGLNTLTLNLQALNNLGQLLGSLLNLNATQVTNQGTVSGGETQITAQQVHNQGKDSVLHGSDTLDLQSHTLNNEGLIQGQELNLNVAASLDNQGKVIGNEVHVT
ncbi:filamentous hemagglutinin N-terminal domain-containing protein, partial [Marinospirillum sp.]|uniref:filamentous hemagglutinin N-terminal domain-containing protein n=1 Tax=Marinospirillum sp. TaxID=2183934 RepID=UPI00286FEAD4